MPNCPNSSSRNTSKLVFDPRPSIRYRNMDEFALHRAAKEGNPYRVMQLIEEGASVDSLDDRGRTPLHWAAEKGQFEVAKVLIDRDCDLNPKDECGRTPALLAAQFEWQRVVDLLLQHGAQVKCADDYKRSLLHRAAGNGWADIVHYMFERGEADPNAATSDGRTPLMEAALRGHEDVAALLIRAGADVNRKSETEWTALHCAALQGHTGVVRVLLEAERLHLNPQDEDGETPLHMACSWGHPEVARQLLEAGADPNIKDSDGKTALSVGIEGEDLNLEEIRLFVQHGAFIQDSAYELICQNPFLKENVLKDVGLCTQSIVNKFHCQSLPALDSIGLHLSKKLPNIDNFRLKARQVDEVETMVRREVERNGFCNVARARPMALSALCVLSLITCQSGMKRAASPDFGDSNLPSKKLHT